MENEKQPLENEEMVVDKIKSYFSLNDEEIEKYL